MICYRVAEILDITPRERAIWRRLARQTDPFDSPLLYPEYITAIAKVRNDLRVGIVEFDNEPVGFLPFHFSTRNSRIAVPAGDVVSDLHAFLSVRDEISFVEWIRGFELTRFDFHHLVEPVPASCVFRRDAWYRINLQAGFDEYTEQLRHSTKIVTQINRKRRQLKRHSGELGLAWKSSETGDLESLIRWKSAQLDSQPGQNHLRMDWVIGLVHELMKMESPDCHGLLSVLRAGNEIAALHFGIVNNTTLVSWLPCVNPRFERFSPGAILFLELAKEAADRGLKLIDLGRGENQTKVRLANDVSQLAIGSVCTSSLTFLRLKSMNLVRHNARQMIARIRNRR